MNTLIRMQHLALSRPPVSAPPEVVAAWYEAKARLHHELAAETGGVAARRERALATQAHVHALSLDPKGVA